MSWEELSDSVDIFKNNRLCELGAVELLTRMMSFVRVLTEVREYGP